MPGHRLSQVPQDCLLAVVVDNEQVALAQTRVEDSSQDRLVVGQKLLRRLRIHLFFGGAGSL